MSSSQDDSSSKEGSSERDESEDQDLMDIFTDILSLLVLKKKEK